MNDRSTRKVGLALGLGIFLLPFVFAWFTLRQGYSTRARVISFGWMILFIFAMANGASEDASERRAEQPPVAVVPPVQTPEQLAEEQRKSDEARFRRNPEEALELADVDGTKVGFDTILELRGKIANAAPFSIKDAEIVCDLFGPSGTQVGQVRETLFEIIPASGEKSFRELSMGFMGSTQVDNFSCRIADAALG